MLHKVGESMMRGRYDGAVGMVVYTAKVVRRCPVFFFFE